jgi:biopolymer transport protein ExbD
MLQSARAKRMEKHHKRNKGAGALNLVSLMDIFTILVFFLLVNSSDVETLPNTKDIQLPESIAEDKAKESVVIMIGEEDILVQGEAVVKVANVLATTGNIAGREVTIMGDKDIPYRLLKKVMATCTESDYGRISLAVLQKSSDKLDSLQATQ